MDQLVQNNGFYYISKTIFTFLDKKTLCKCRLVCKTWNRFIDYEIFNWMEILQSESEKNKNWLEQNEEWRISIENIWAHGNILQIKKMTVILTQFKNSNVAATPCHLGTLHLQLLIVNTEGRLPIENN